LLTVHQTRTDKQYIGSSKNQNQWPKKEMGNWTKQNFFKEVQIAKIMHEKMLTIPGHKGNAIETTLRLHPTPVRIGIIKNTSNYKCWRWCREKWTLIHCWWDCKSVEPLWKTRQMLLKILKLDLS
jgi:hypothetical protein